MMKIKRHMDLAFQTRRETLGAGLLLGERVKQVLINGRKQTFERILKSKAAKVFGTAGAAPDSDVAELVVEHPLSECLHVDFVME